MGAELEGGGGRSPGVKHHLLDSSGSSSSSSVQVAPQLNLRGKPKGRGQEAAPPGPVSGLSGQECAACGCWLQPVSWRPNQFGSNRSPSTLIEAESDGICCEGHSGGD